MGMYSQSLYHHGIKGQKWGVRRFQNEDGSLTEEGKKRYLYNIGKQLEIYSKVTDKANQDLAKINKKYENADLNDDEINLAYTKEVNESFKRNYRDVLAKDIGSDEASLRGQSWLNSMYNYNLIETDVAELEAKVRSKKEKASHIPKQSKKDPVSSSPKQQSTGEKYANTKMSREKAYETLNRDLEKKYGEEFWDLPYDKQNELMMEYANSSGLYRWM